MKKFEVEAAQEEDISSSAVIRKIDLKLLPFLGLCYLLSFLDRANIGKSKQIMNNTLANARVSNASSGHNIDASLGLTDAQAQLCIAIFFAGYVLFEVPSNMALKYFSPSTWIARIMFTWGCTCIGMAFVRDFWGLFVCRLILGIFEAGFFPGVIFYLTFWYIKAEQSYRIALFFCAGAPLAGMVGGFLAYALSYMDGYLGLDGWQWIFLLEGIPTALIGIVCYYYLPDYPDTCRFMNANEKEFVLNRLERGGANTCTESTLDMMQVRKALTDPKTYLFCVAFFLSCSPLYCITFALPSILYRLGYTDTMAQAMSIPPYAGALICTLFISYLSDKTQKRTLFLIFSALIQIVGFVGMIAGKSTLSSYVFCILTCIGVFSCAPTFFAFVTNNLTGSTTAGLVTAMVVATGNLGGILNAYLYPKSGAPHHILGNTVNAAFAAIFILDILLIRFLLLRQQRQTGIKVIV